MLVPTLARRLGDRVRPPRPAQVERRWLVVAAVATLAVPVTVTAAADRIQPPTPAIVQPTDTEATILTPVDKEIALEVVREGAGERLTWTPGSWRADVFYRVYRKDGPGEDTQCALSDGVAWSCYLLSAPIATTRETTFVDPSPPADGATYRIGVGTNWVDDPAQGDVFDFSPPAPAAR